MISLPLLVLISIIIPYFWIYKRMKSNKYNLSHSIKIYISLSIYYAEYKDQYYYWEVFRMLFKIFIFLSIGVVSENIFLKGSLISIFMAVYLRLLYVCKPYKRNLFNKIDFYSTICLLV